VKPRRGPVVRRFGAPRAVLVALPLLALFAVLARWQWRWLDEMADAEGGTLSASAAGRAAQLERDFDRELGRAYFCLQVSTHGDPAESWPEFAAAYDAWRRRAPYPDLVGEIYMASAVAGGALRFSSFAARRSQFVPAAWPPALDAVRGAIEKERHTPPPSPDDALWPRLPVVAAEVPAIVVPIWIGPKPVYGYVVVALDMDFVRGRFLPRLADRYFGANGSRDFEFVVTPRADENVVLFASRASAPRAAADAEVDLFGIWWANLDQPFYDPPGAGGDRAVTDGVGGWRLRVHHRAGSVPLFVAHQRRNNAVLMIAIMALLAGGAAVLVLALARARRLAAQQVGFVAAVSHDLRTPVSVICSAAENLRDGVVDASRVQAYGDAIEREGRRLADLVEQVLTFARIERAATKRAPLDLGALVADVVETFADRAAKASVEIVLAIESPPPGLLADAVALRRAIENLLANAIVHGGGGGVVRVAVTRRPGAVELLVADEGPGMESAEARAVFEPFVRGRRAEELAAPGTGLGLWIVREVVRAHDGRVHVESAPGRGCRVLVRLPEAA